MKQTVASDLVVFFILVLVVGGLLLYVSRHSQPKTPKWMRDVQEQTARDPDVARRWREAEATIQEAKEKLEKYRAEKEAKP